MKNNSDALLYLERFERAATVIPNKLIEIEQWHDIATSITAVMNSECVSSSGSKQKMADAVDKCLDIVDDLQRQVDELDAVKRDVIHTIEQVRSTREYNLLHMKYIQLKSLQDIADEFDRDYTWVTTTHGRALKSVEAVLRERKNNNDGSRID